MVEFFISGYLDHRSAEVERRRTMAGGEGERNGGQAGNRGEWWWSEDGCEVTMAVGGR